VSSEQDRELVWSELHLVAAQVELSIGPHSHTSSSSQQHGKDCHLSFFDYAAGFFFIFISQHKLTMLVIFVQ